MLRIFLCIVFLILSVVGVHAGNSENVVLEIRQANEQMLRLYKSGRFDDALGQGIKLVKRAERVLGREHPDTLASINNLAGLYYNRKQYTLAEPLYERSMEIFERILGRDHPVTLGSVNNLAALYYAQGRYILAEPLYKRALEARERTNGKEHPLTLRTAGNLLKLYQSQGRYELTQDLLKRFPEAIRH